MEGEGLGGLETALRETMTDMYDLIHVGSTGIWPT